MAQQGEDPTLSVKLTKVVWILVFAIIFLAWAVLGFEAAVERMILKEAKSLFDIVDHEMDDTNDNYEESLQLILENNCEEAVKNYHDLMCKIGIKEVADEYAEHDMPQYIKGPNR